MIFRRTYSRASAAWPREDGMGVFYSGASGRDGSSSDASALILVSCVYRIFLQ